MNITLDANEIERLKRPDQKLIVAKQRHGTAEPTINLWFHDSSMQFLGAENHSVRTAWERAA